MGRAKVIKPATQQRGWSDAEEGFRLAYIEGNAPFQTLLQKFRLSAQQAAAVIRECPDCDRARRARFAENRREKLKKAKQRRNVDVMQLISEVAFDLVERLDHLADRLKVIEEALNVQADQHDDGTES